MQDEKIDIVGIQPLERILNGSVRVLILGRPIQYVQRILPIVAASQSVKGKPEEKEFLDKWVNVCDWQ